MVEQLIRNQQVVSSNLIAGSRKIKGLSYRLSLFFDMSISLNHSSLRLLGFLYFVLFLRHGMIFPLIPLYVDRLGFSPSAIGMIVGCFSFMSMLLAIPIGRITDRLGVRPLLLAGVAANIVHSLLLMKVQTLGLLLAAQLFGGLGFLLIIVSSQAYITGLSETSLRERGFGLISLTSAVGQMFGPFLGGTLLNWTTYSQVFGLSVLLACLGFCILWLKPQASSTRTVSLSLRHSLGEIRSMLSSPYLLAVLSICFSVVFVASLRSSFLPILLQEKGFGPGLIGFLLSSFAVSMTGLRLFVGRLMGTVSRVRLMAVTLLLLIAGISALPLFASASLLSLELLIFGLGFGLSQPLTMVMVSDFRHSGLAMGLRFSVINLAAFSSPLLMGWVVHGLGLDWAFYLGGGCLVLVAGCLGIYAHRHVQQTGRSFF